MQQIVTLFTAQRISSRAADQGVIASSAVYCVVPATCVDQVIGSVPCQILVRVIAQQGLDLDCVLPPNVAIGKLDAINLITGSGIAHEVIHDPQRIGRAIDPNH
ncbi:hypothetical protein ALO35_200091 [Pseudomonas amygdali pv. lachrymans]|uniref:Uncharacterized protein n=1 Tax=Pseudomonas amygdali pv. lachrymans TaxID=53707 RepID=A0A0P9T1W1_PSEAV|nr:hypothetical protein ALO35_200091 [Pseudomonas amygdali pv. lachrymans]